MTTRRKWRLRRSLAALSLVAGPLGCDVEPYGVRVSGIADVEELSAGECGRGFLVVQSDYDSSNLSAIDAQGNTLSASLASSGMTKAGLVQVFSGDVVLPSERQSAPEAILINRYPQSVLSFLDLGTAKVRQQIDVSTGFASNPHDAIRLADGRIVVARFDSNLAHGRQPFDEGGDLLVLDRAQSRIVKRVDLRAATPKATERWLPHPERMLRVGERVFVVVSLYSADDRLSDASYLVTLDAETIELIGSVELAGFSGCAGLSLAPDATELTVACTGTWNDTSSPSTSTAGLIGVDITSSPVPTWTFMASALEPPQPLNFFVAYAGPHHVLAMAMGAIGTQAKAAEFDRLIRYDTRTGLVDEPYRVSGSPFSLGDVRCLPECGRCAVSDASRRSALLLFQNTERNLELVDDVPIDAGLGLPTRWLGVF